MEEAGGNITMNFIIKEQKEKLTTLDDSNPFWLAFKQATDDLLVNIHIEDIYITNELDVPINCVYSLSAVLTSNQRYLAVLRTVDTFAESAYRH